MTKNICEKQKSISAHRYTFTIFTPTYNRAYTLHRVYESLKAQTFHDFEWLIVDDGSTDNTIELVEAWKQQANLPIRYCWQENQGLHIAINHGVQEAHGELFLKLDSDDTCVPEALERFNYHWKSIPEKEREEFTGVTALCVNQSGRLVGTRFPRDITDSDSLEIHYKYKVKGNKWGFHRTDVLRKFPFPAIKGVKRVPSSFIWKAIARNFKTRYVNEVLRVYFTGESGRSDQLSKSGMKHAKGAAFAKRSILNNDIGWFCHAPKQLLFIALQYTRYSLHAGTSVLEQVKMLNNIPARVLWAMTLPLGFLVYFRDRR